MGLFVNEMKVLKNLLKSRTIRFKEGVDGSNKTVILEKNDIRCYLVFKSNGDLSDFHLVSKK